MWGISLEYRHENVITEEFVIKSHDLTKVDVYDVRNKNMKRHDVYEWKP